MSDWRAQYWDSTLFLSYLDPLQPERVRVMRELLRAREQGTIEIVISTLVIAEVRSLPTPGAPATLGAEHEVETQPLDPVHEDTLKRFFSSDQLDYRPLTVRIARRAADIGDRFPRLLPADCVHIATALEAEVDVLFTYDGAGRRRRPEDMIRYDGRIEGLRIHEPFVPMGPLWDTER